MAMPGPQSAANARWWATWHAQHGLGSTAEVAFSGYLQQQNIPALSVPPEALDVAWTNYLVWFPAAPLT